MGFHFGVSILVLVDVALKELRFVVIVPAISVSILVLVDVALKDRIFSRFLGRKCVIETSFSYTYSCWKIMDVDKNTR